MLGICGGFLEDLDLPFFFDLFATRTLFGDDLLLHDVGPDVIALSGFAWLLLW